jgi:hypothetical protein
MHQLHNVLRCFECPGHLKILSIYYVRYLKFAYVSLNICLGQESTTCRRHTFWWMWVAWSLGHDSLSDWKTWCKERSCPALALGALGACFIPPLAVDITCFWCPQHLQLCEACYIVELALYFLVHRFYFFVNENAGWNFGSRWSRWKKMENIHRRTWENMDLWT